MRLDLWKLSFAALGGVVTAESGDRAVLAGLVERSPVKVRELVSRNPGYKRVPWDADRCEKLPFFPVSAETPLCPPGRFPTQ